MSKTLTILDVIIVLGVVGGGAAPYLLRETSSPSGDGDRTPAPAESTEAARETPGQPEWRPADEFISAPGTWESSADDDPFNPQANSRSFMLSIPYPLK